MIHFACPSCGKNFKVKDEFAGKRTECPKCSQTMTVPATAQSADIQPSATEPLSPPQVVRSVLKTSSVPQDGDSFEDKNDDSFNDTDEDSFDDKDSDSLDDFVPRTRKSKVPRSKEPERSPRRVGLFVGLGASAVVLVLGTITLTLWGSGFFSKATVAVSGELFVTTRGGDVKKAAGEKVYFTLLSPELQKQIPILLADADQSEAEGRRIFEEGYEKLGSGAFWDSEDDEGKARYKAFLEEFDKEYGAQDRKARDKFKSTLAAAQSMLLAATTDVVADSDGKFKMEIAPEKYLLWTRERKIGDQSFSWCKIVEARSTAPNLILSEDSVYLIGKESDPTHRLLRIMATALGKP